MQQGSQSEQKAGALGPWDPFRLLRSIDPMEVKFSRGFLRSRPEKWFPNFGTHWLPLVHSLGMEIKLLEVRPTLVRPRGWHKSFCVSVDGELLGFFMDEVSLGVILEAVVPGADQDTNDVIAEYLARRLLGSLALSWSGPDSSVPRFESQTTIDAQQGVAAVKLLLEVNAHHCIVWVTMGHMMLERLDGLWRRQVRSSARSQEETFELRLEIGQLAVPAPMLVEYLKPGTVVDLEVPVSDSIALRLGHKTWLPARLCAVNKQLGFEIVSGPVHNPLIPEGATRLAVEFGSLNLDSSSLAEIGQVGAFWDSGIELSDRVQMIINGEKVSDARLYCYEGRFAISVV